MGTEIRGANESSWLIIENEGADTQENIRQKIRTAIRILQ